MSSSKAGDASTHSARPTQSLPSKSDHTSRNAHTHTPSDDTVEVRLDDHASSAVPHMTRRTFLTWVSASGAGLGAMTREARSATPADADTAPLPIRVDAQSRSAGTVPVNFTLNGQAVTVHVDPRTTLLDTVREKLELTGTKKGCDHGQCGACTVHVNGRRINSCLSLAVMNEGAAVTTIEGLGRPGKLHPMQQAFVDHDGYQCGYCTSGQIMSAVGLLSEPWGAGDAEVQEAMSGNICRCGAYKNIVAAIQHVRKG